MGRPAPSRAAAAGSRCASSRAPTWRWRRSRPSCAAGSRRPYGSKADVDANYKAVLDVLLRPDVRRRVRHRRRQPQPLRRGLGARLRGELRGAGRPGRLEIEMLEGMAPAQAAAVATPSPAISSSTRPSSNARDFPSALAYLVRRLDENTSAENFLAHLFDLAADPARVRRPGRSGSRAAVRDRHIVDATVAAPRAGSRPPRPRRSVDEPFANAPDTDWTHPENRALDHRRPRRAARSLTATARPLRRPPTSTRQSTPRRRRVPGWWGRRRRRAGRAPATASPTSSRRIAGGSSPRWPPTRTRSSPRATRRCPRRSTSPATTPRAARRLADVDGRQTAALGTVVVAPPWNFPFAIPAGGVLAALAAGNAVILKPRAADRCDRAG